jgi:streptomycin 6-kinase
MFKVPAGLVDDRVRVSGAEGRRWVDALPDLVAVLCRDWSVALDDEAPVAHGGNALVVPVRRGSQPLVLKVSWHRPTLAAEAIALAAWGGRGAVHLVDERLDAGALLLERLDAGRSLRTVGVFAAAAHAGALIRRLTVPAPTGLPRVSEYGLEIGATLHHRQHQLGDPLPVRFVDMAAERVGELAVTAGDDLVHADLHYGNILAGTREPWLAIDPHAVVGDPELSVPELLWTRVDEIADVEVRPLLRTIADAGQLDLDRAERWATVRAVDYWLWGLEHGLTVDPLRCERILSTLGPPFGAGT